MSAGCFPVKGEDDVTDQVFIYLLSQKDKPGTAELLKQVFGHTLATSTSWIATGNAPDQGKRTLFPFANRSLEMKVVIVYSCIILIMNEHNEQNNAAL